MTKTEVSFLLTAIYVYERREQAVSKVEVEAWHQLLASADFDDAKAVVTAHFAESDRRLSPAQILKGSRELAAARKPKEDTAQRLRVPNADPDDPTAFIRALRAGDYQPEPTPGTPPQGGLPLAAIGRRVPPVTSEEVADDTPRPRRWWLSRKQKSMSEDDVNPLEG
jgi:hypothetical protein